ncbi:dihydrolipoyl dehydrogenase, apicoplast, putative [Plasmodium ovale]|uniref:Dihydrolipoyl dehydrogenase, apicoplast, putative n=1 Tax=Plasmodium ovale TaxID=36330 RepID=A0A1C3KPD7_PLAOA|nr:dihydrolipoyl dehydrogenase, apicoplast, putative [Plasmodium ovale]
MKVQINTEVMVLIWLVFLFLLSPSSGLQKEFNNGLGVSLKGVEKANHFPHLTIACTHRSMFPRKGKNVLFVKSKMKMGNIRSKRNSNFSYLSGENSSQGMTIREDEYDVAILGCGVGGHAAAINAMERNLKVVLFAGEESSIGGTCVNVGCIPSKSLLYATNKYRELKNFGKLYNYGIYSDFFMKKESNNVVTSPMESNQIIANSVRMDIDKLKEYTQTVVGKMRNGILNGLKNPKFSKNSEHVKVIYEHGHIIDVNTIKSKKSGKKYKVKNIILATGSTPNIPSNVQVDKKYVFTSDQAVNLEGLRDYMGIIGMGIIGLEFADVYTALGSEVTFFEYSPDMLPMIDRDVAKYFEKVFIKTKPVSCIFNAQVKYVHAVKSGGPVVIGYVNRSAVQGAHRRGSDTIGEDATVGEENAVKELRVDSCLVAVGRKPNTENLGLENVQVKTNRGFVPVDELLRVKMEDNLKSRVHENIFCIGDANGKQMLAHTASHQALRVVDYIENKEKNHINEFAKNKLSKSIFYTNIPSVCYTNPELAFVGLTEHESEKMHPDNVGVEVSYYKANSKILCENNISEHGHKNNLYNKGQYNTNDNTNGMVKVVYKKNTKEILGTFIVGNYASVLIHEAVLAINLKLTVFDLAYMVHSHPTVSEVLDTAFKSASKIRTH